MIEISNRQIVIDGRPRILLCGEIHYFRLRRDEWQDRIDKLRAAGFNAVASYIPWLCHEPVEGSFDLDGHTRPELDVGAFIDLCRDNGLLFFARPGPFVMAELKNEGLPYWLYTKHPEIVPRTWDEQPVTSKTVDYLAPAFLQAARSWYRAVMPLLARRLQPHGGNVFAVQLDNEIGMLSWVTNSPDLTDALLDDFAAWLERIHDAATLRERYGLELHSSLIRNTAFRSPREEYAPALLHDLGRYMRDRFRRYVATLRGYAEESGVRDVPFVVNIHGTAGWRGLTYPIGISQLYESYTRDAGYLSGSDIYLGDLDTRNFQDLYLCNAFMAAVHRPEQPLTSVEFEAGSGDYDSSFGHRNHPSAVDFKTRMCIAQGNRLLNVYLFAGGRNYRLDEPPGDGNDRIAFTGERHGFAAPLDPEGELSYSYQAMSGVAHTIMAVADKLSVMEQQHDGVAWAFVPDYWMTETRYGPSSVMNEIVDNLEANRGQGAWESMARAMLLAGYRFGAHDVQNRHFDPQTVPVLVLPSARYMHAELQQRLVEYLEAGGRLLVYGELPLFDMLARPSTVLADALGLRPLGAIRGDHRFFLSLVADGWAAPRPELRSHFAQLWEPSRGDVLWRVYGSGEACGLDVGLGRGRAVIVTAALPCDIEFFRSALERLGAPAGLRHDCREYGIWMTTTEAQGERFLFLLNLDGFAKTLHFADHGTPLFDGRALELEAKAGLMLPLGVRFGEVEIVYATAEVAAVEPATLTFRLTQARDCIALRSTRPVAPSDEYDLEQHGDTTLVHSRKHARVDDRLVVRLR